MNMEIQVRNYRCFNEAHPAVLRIHRGTTALIGANNAGKSTLLRLFYELRPLFAKLAESPAVWAALLNESIPLPQPLEVEDREAILHRHARGDLVLNIRVLDCDLSARKPDPRPYIVPGEIDLVVSRKNFRVIARVDGARGRFQVVDARGSHARLTGGEAALITVSWPVLQELFGSLADSLYIGPYRALRPFPEEDHSYDLQLGASFFKKFLRVHETEKARFNEGARRLERDMRSIFQFKKFEVAVLGRPAALFFDINGERYRIDELGSGVGQVFLILAHAHLLRPAYVFIDEPECHLHPSIQAEFVTALNGYARKALFLATHSMGLARSAGDRIYQVVRHPSDRYTTVQRYRPEERLSEVLGEINFSVQQQAGCRKILLVEGPTEVKAVRQFLRHLGQDRQVVIIPLGGSSMINGHRDDELREIARICPDVFALIDSEKPSPREVLSVERQGFVRSCGKSGIECHVLERRSLESYLTRAAIQKVLGKGFQELGPYDDVKRRYGHWPKSDNWKIVREMALRDFEQTDLGQYLRFVIESPCRVAGVKED
ncbi:MAG: AAA family ATPase [Candidatus Methylacidiphilales bacterium]|nr:AAA family ATPase [Candidatus Methylacidiphilales bacterium]